MSTQLDLLAKMSAFLCLPVEEIIDIANGYSKKYRRYSIQKKHGGYRYIYHPCREIKALQQSMLYTFINSLPVHEIAYAYIPGKKSPLRCSAEKHKTYRYTVRIDFKDFFPSIRPQDLVTVIKDNYSIVDDEYTLIQQVLFYQQTKNSPHVLPVGAPSSPAVSNAVMLNLDKRFQNEALTLDPKSSITRYADDLYFSTDIKNLCHTFYDNIREVLCNTKNPNLSVNTTKTLFLSTNTRRVVNGLTITPSGSVSIGRKRKNLVNTLIYRFAKGLLRVDEIPKLKGLLAFIQDCDPDYYNKLAIKHGDCFYRIINHQTHQK